MAHIAFTLRSVDWSICQHPTNSLYIGMTQSIGKRTVSPYVGNLSTITTRCLGSGSAQLAAGCRIEPRAVGVGVRRAAQFHFID